jgi:predicted metal-binding membrane protein
MPPTLDAMTSVQPWTATEFGLRLAMWAVMMVAMMVPTAAPMTLMYAAVARKAAAQRNPLAPTFVFVTGYITMWTIFSLVATIAQHALDRAALLSPMMVSRSASFGAVLLIAAGIYQFTRSRTRVSGTAGPQRTSCPAIGAPATSARSAWDCGSAPTAWAAAGS